MACTAKTLYILPKIRSKYSQKWNCAASFPIPAFMFRWAIYIILRSVCLFCWRKIGVLIVVVYKSLTETWMWKLGQRPCSSFRGIHKSDFLCSGYSVYDPSLFAKLSYIIWNLRITCFIIWSKVIIFFRGGRDTSKKCQIFRLIILELQRLQSQISIESLRSEVNYTSRELGKG